MEREDKLTNDYCQYTKELETENVFLFSVLFVFPQLS